MSTPTPPHAEPTPEREERELAALYRQLPATEPDAALDARVLDAARRAASRRPKRYRGLLFAFAGAAGLAMAAGLAWHLYADGHGPASGTSPAAPGQVSRPPAIAPIREVVPVRILSGTREARSPAAERTPAQEATAAGPAGTPAPDAQETSRSPEKTIRVVVPVRIIPAGKAQAHAGTVPRTPEPPDARSLIAQARRALERKDEARARKLVRAWIDRHPDQTLPADLARLKPPLERPGSP